jgi:hypothetical protein
VDFLVFYFNILNSIFSASWAYPTDLIDALKFAECIVCEQHGRQQLQELAAQETRVAEIGQSWS